MSSLQESPMDTSLSQFELPAVPADNPEETLDEYVLDSDSNGTTMEEPLPKTVTVLKHEKTGAEVYLVGTAHFSRESQKDVERVIRMVKPSVVVLELCKARLNILTLKEEALLEEAKNINFEKMMHTIKTDGVYNGLMYLLLLDISAHITKELGMAPGGEFRVAYQEARNIKNCTVSLGDRPINVTIQRSIHSLSWWQTATLVWHLLNAKGPISNEEIESCKNQDILDQLLADFGGKYQGFRKALLDERNIYLTHSLQTQCELIFSKRPPDSKEPIKIVGVVGIGHVSGIVQMWPYDQEPYMKEIMIIPPPSKLSKTVKFTIKAIPFVLGGYIIYRFVPVPQFIKTNTNSFLHSLLFSIQKIPRSINFELLSRNVGYKVMK